MPLFFQLEICLYILQFCFFYQFYLIPPPKMVRLFFLSFQKKRHPLLCGLPAISLSSTFGAPMWWQHGGYYWPSGRGTEWLDFWDTTDTRFQVKENTMKLGKKQSHGFLEVVLEFCKVKKKRYLGLGESKDTESLHRHCGMVHPEIQILIQIHYSIAKRFSTNDVEKPR